MKRLRCDYCMKFAKYMIIQSERIFKLDNKGYGSEIAKPYDFNTAHRCEEHKDEF